MAYTHLNKLGRDLILDVINRTNSSSITFMDVDFSLPTALSNPGAARNTSVLVTALPNSRYKGSRLVWYWRLDIAQVISEDYRRFPVEGSPTNTLQLAQELNIRYGLRLTAEDIFVDEIDTLTKPVNITIRIKPGSYAFHGEVVLNIVSPAIDLSDIITIDLLEGLVYPEDVVYSIGNIQFNNPETSLMYSPVVTDAGIYFGDNNELELGAGFYLIGSESTWVPTPDGNIAVQTTEGDLWRLVVSANLLDNSRGEDLTDLYDINLHVFHEGGGDVEFNLAQNTINNTLKFVSDHGPVTDHVPGYGLGFAKFQGMIDLVDVGDGFINLNVDVSGGVLGRFTLRVKATPKRNLLIMPIEFEMTLNVIRPAATQSYQITITDTAPNGEFPVLLNLVTETNEAIFDQAVIWTMTNSVGWVDQVTGTSSEQPWNGLVNFDGNYDDWYNEGAPITVTAELSDGTIYTGQVSLPAPVALVTNLYSGWTTVAAESTVMGFDNGMNQTSMTFSLAGTGSINWIPETQFTWGDGDGLATGQFEISAEIVDRWVSSNGLNYPYLTVTENQFMPITEGFEIGILEQGFVHQSDGFIVVELTLRDVNDPTNSVVGSFRVNKMGIG